MSSEQKNFWLSTKGVAALSLIGAVTYFLLTEHRGHVFAFLPYLIFLLCPLMHLFMHRGHGHGNHGSGSHCRHGSDGEPTNKISRADSSDSKKPRDQDQLRPGGSS